MTYQGLQFSPELSPQPDRDAKDKRKEMRELITGVRKHPVLKKEQQKPHPDHEDHSEKLKK